MAPTNGTPTVEFLTALPPPMNEATRQMYEFTRNFLEVSNSVEFHGYA